MKRKILVAVDDSFHSKCCIRYLAKLVRIIPDLHFTLVHVQPGISQFLIEEARREMRAKVELKKIERRNREAAEKLLEAIKGQMAENGIDGDRVRIRTLAKKLGLAKDIIELAQEDRYDAIAAGRRGLTGIQELFLGSLTAKLVEHSTVIPIWIIDGEVPNPKILLAADGSESAFRALDHVCFMIGENPEASLTLFHVTPQFGDYCRIDFSEPDPEIEQFIVEGDKRCIDDFYAHATKTCRKSGISGNRVEIKQSRRKVGVGKAIIEEARKGNYGTVVIGRRGTGKSFYMGSVSRYVMAKAVNRAVWLIP
ncbi:MAG: universal stress protein [Desulfobacterales bacterium]|jgi:nucleotide-binding universal stress UspA family protein